jgi:hypothetical protein
LESVKSAALRSLIYFDIFNYPLTVLEIIQFSSVRINHLSDMEEALQEMAESILIYRFGDFYSLNNEQSWIERRRRGNKNALEVQAKALKRSRFIYHFPFVRSVNISGSLSKNYFDENTDFDFFVITSPNRIWITRMLLTLYKKIFLLNNRKYFCINYYIDTEDLNIPDRNLFSATEVITLKNKAGESVYRHFIESNKWVMDYFPNFIPDFTHLDLQPKLRLKTWLEKCLSGKFGDRLDNFSFRITLRFLKKRYVHLTPEEFSVNLRTKKNASKHHPQGFQFRVLQAYDEKCAEFEKHHEFKLL